MKVPNHLYVLGDTYTCHTYCCYVYHFTNIGCTLFTCDMYMCRLRHINDSVLSSLKKEGICLLFFIFVPLLLPQTNPTKMLTQRVWRLTFREYSKCVTWYTIYVSLAVNVPGMTSRYVVAREKWCARSQGHMNITLPKTYKCQNTYMFRCLNASSSSSSLSSGSFDMDMSYTRVLHIKVAYRVPHKWRNAFYVTRPLLCASITCYVTVITVEINHCSFRRVRFAFLYIVTRSKIV
jgi:hypothetical protein